jgi:hypothetical protein
MARNTNFDIPFDNDGHMMDEENYRTSFTRPNFQFHARLAYRNHYRTRATEQLEFECLDAPYQGRRFYMYLSELLKALPTHSVIGGVIEGDWTFYKRGCKITLGLVS